MPIEITVPAMGESVVEATIAQWLKKPGDKVEAGEEIVELETDKVNQAIQAESSGVLVEIKKQEGDTVGVGEVLAVISENGAAAAAPAPVAAAPAPAAESAPAPAGGNGREAHATPLARAVAEGAGVDLASVTGSGPNNRIVASDVAKVQQSAIPQTTKQSGALTTDPRTMKTVDASQLPPRPAPSTANGRSEKREKMTRRRQAIAANLLNAKQSTAMLTTFNEVDLTAVMEIRKRRKESFEKQFGVGLGFMSFFTKATIGALKAFPYVNAEIQGDEIVVKGYYDIGIAVGAEQGLVVPVVRDADKKSFAQIEKDIKGLAAKAQANELALSDLQGGTFTITNGGVYGSLMSTPILNHPQVGILGMHTIQQRPVAVNGEVVIRPMMYIALSYDHRIIDGSTAVRFLVKIKQLLEDPETLLLEG